MPLIVDLSSNQYNHVREDTTETTDTYVPSTSLMLSGICSHPAGLYAKSYIQLD